MTIEWTIPNTALDLKWASRKATLPDGRKLKVWRSSSWTSSHWQLEVIEHRGNLVWRTVIKPFDTHDQAMARAEIEFGGTD